MIKAVPTFVSSFQQMAMDLPLPTVILIAVSNFFTRWWVVMLVVILVFLLFWKLWGCTENGALIQSRIRLKMPVLGKLRLQRLSGQFAATMSTLLAAGIPLIRAVESTAQVLDNALICKELNTQLPRLTEGKTLASCLKNCPFLPELLVEMTSIRRRNRHPRTDAGNRQRLLRQRGRPSFSEDHISFGTHHHLCAGDHCRIDPVGRLPPHVLALQRILNSHDSVGTDPSNRSYILF